MHYQRANEAKADPLYVASATNVSFAEKASRLGEAATVVSHPLGGRMLAGAHGEESDHHASDEESDDDVEAILEDIDDHLACLLEFAPAIKNCCENVSLIPKASDFIVSTPSYSYIQAVRDKFAKVNPRLADRLGEAN